MPKQRIIYYSDSQAAIEWAILSENKDIEQVSRAQSVSEIESLPGKNDTISLISCEYLSIHQTEIPTQSLRQLTQAIPFALEDELATDISACEFCCFHNDRQFQHCAVFTQSTWQEITTTLAPLNPSYIVPECFALPYTANHWSILVTPSRAIIRSGEFSGFSLSRDLLPYLLSESIQSSNTAPEKIDLYSTEKLTLESEIPVQWHQIESAFSLLLENLPPPEQFNCLRGKSRQSEPSSIQRILPYTSAALSAVACLAFVGNLLWQNHHLREVNSQYEQAITQTYREVFPNATQVIAPKVRFNRELSRLKDNVSGGRVQQLLQTLAPVLLKQTGLSVTELRFSNNQLRLQLVAPSISALEQVVQDLKQQQIQSELNNASAKNQQANAELIIKEV